MSITDELREYTEKQIKWLDMSKVHYRKLFAIADRIDAEHKKACDDAWDNGYEADYLGIEKWLTEHPQVMEHHGWIRLPKDADGEYIHVGDVMEWIDIEGEVTLTCEVAAVGVDCFFAWDKANGRYAQKSASAYRHYHAPTVEDVLRQVIACANNGQHVHGALATEDIIAEYAAKLRLAGEDA